MNKLYKQTKKKIVKKNLSEKPVELKFPNDSIVCKNVVESDYFYRDLEMFRPDLDE